MHRKVVCISKHAIGGKATDYSLQWIAFKIGIWSGSFDPRLIYGQVSWSGYLRKTRGLAGNSNYLHQLKIFQTFIVILDLKKYDQFWRFVSQSVTERMSRPEKTFWNWTEKQNYVVECHFLVQLKKFWFSQKTIGPTEGPGISFAHLANMDAQTTVSSQYVCKNPSIDLFLSKILKSWF